ncbi:hypothetical protein HHK36_028037 [Tetracentron sinense]|uniref:DAGKc domain-containing protein n=1 Tax=Tetracentron sinense TaxID=13715 RepID=A0A834YFV5_TETSI|nr:hypothetical protein HHK36_028037 [Tetracentron sinense]
MERKEDGFVGDNFLSNIQLDGEKSAVSSNFFLDHVGEVVLSLNSDGLSWKLVESENNEPDGSYCLGVKLASKFETEIKFSDVYAVEESNWGLIHESNRPKAKGCLLGHDSEMYHFTVHGMQRSKTRRSLWVLAVYTFGHVDLQTCETWVNQINASIKMEVGRPKSLLVFVHPESGKWKGFRTWETVAPIFSLAKVQTKVTVTQRAGQAFDVMASITDRELNSYDGVVVVGGDGFFNEVLNGLLSSRHKAPYPPAPADFLHSAGNDSAFIRDPNETAPETSHQREDQDPLLLRSGFSNLGMYHDNYISYTSLALYSMPQITTGTRDPVTSALHIVLGKRVCLDIAQVVRWKTTPSSKDAPCVRYAASFAG